MKNILNYIIIIFLFIKYSSISEELYKGPFIYGQERTWDFLEQGKFKGSLVKIEDNKAFIKMENGSIQTFDPARGEGTTVSFLQRAMCKLPEKPNTPLYKPGNNSPLIELSAEDLDLGQLRTWKNKGRLKGNFLPLNQPPKVQTIQGRKAVVFSHSMFLTPLNFEELVSDFYMPQKVAEDCSITVVADLYNNGSIVDRETFLSWGNKDCGEEDCPDFSYGCYDALQWYREKIKFPEDRFPKITKWHQIAFVLTPKNNKICDLKIYNDGALILNTNITKPDKKLTSENLIFIGCAWEAWWSHTWPTRPARPYTGGIGSLKVYDRPLSIKELHQLSNQDCAYSPDPYNGKILSTLTPRLSWEPGLDKNISYTLYLSEDKEAVIQNKDSAKKGSLKANSFTPGKLEEGKTYYWKVTQSAPGKTQEKIWSFTAAEPGAVFPIPKDNTNDISTTIPKIQWTPAPNARAQTLHFGTDLEKVRTGQAFISKDLKNSVNFALFSEINPEKDIKYKTSKTIKPQYERAYIILEKLQPSTQYYWRIEHLDNNGKIIQGKIWSFKTMPFELEYDGPVSEPFPSTIRQDGFYGKFMDSESGPIISPQESHDEWMRAARYSLRKISAKRPDIVRALLASRAATHLSTPLNPDWGWSEFTCASYGSGPSIYKEDSILLHEMGHQYHMNGCEALEYDFRHRLNNIFDENISMQKWIGDYGARNMWENVAVWATGWTNNLSQDEGGITPREQHMINDPKMYNFLSKYWPGDTFIELRPETNLILDKKGIVKKWINNGGIEFFKSGEGWKKYKKSVGSFTSYGSPKSVTVGGHSAIKFNSGDSLIWDKKTWDSMDGGRSWAVELWVYREIKPVTNETMIFLGDPNSPEVALIWGNKNESSKFSSGNISYWKNKPKAGKWQHIIYSYSNSMGTNNSGTLEVYVNGKLDSKSKMNLDVKKNQRIGIGNAFTGALGFIRFYNYNLHPLQIAEISKENQWFTTAEQLIVADKLIVDLDANRLGPYRQEDIWPTYPKSLQKDWLRSWNNCGTLGGKFYNERSGKVKSEPKVQKINGRTSICFSGQEHMVGPYLPSEINEWSIDGWIYPKEANLESTILQAGKYLIKVKPQIKNKWQHLAVTIKDNEMHIYLKGELHSKETISPQKYKSERFLLGGQFNGNSWTQSFHGAISKLRIHKGILTEKQIMTLANSGTMCSPASPTPSLNTKVAASASIRLKWSAPVNTLSDKFDLYWGNSLQEVLSAEKFSKNIYQGKWSSGSYSPTLSPGKTYYWRVDPLNKLGEPINKGNIWSFKTYSGLLIDLSADDLNNSNVIEWKNKGKYGGSFIPVSLTDIKQPQVEKKDGHTSVYFDSDKYRGKYLKSNFMAPKELNGENAFTVSYWAYTKQLDGNSGERLGTVVSWGGPKDFIEFSWGWHPKWGALRLKNGTEIGFKGSISNDMGPQNHNAPLIFKWHHIAYVYHGRNKRSLDIYVDGLLNRSESINIDIPTDSQICIGGLDVNGHISRYFHGHIRELAICAQALDKKTIIDISKGKNAYATNIDWLVLLDSVGLNDGPVQMWKNKGALGGGFNTPQAKSQAAKLDKISGRKSVVFDGRTTFLQSTFSTPDEICANKPFTVDIVVYNPKLSAKETIIALAPGISQRSFPGAVTASAANFNYANQITGKPKVNDSPGAFDNGRFSIAWEQTAPKPKIWHRLIYVYSGGKNGYFKVYDNGKLVLKKSHFNLNTLSGYPIYLGSAWITSTGPKNPFSGAISSIKVYDYPFAEEDIKK